MTDHNWQALYYREKARAESAEAALRDAQTELAIEREGNPNRVVCPKCFANLPCESCARYSVLRDELEARVQQLKAALQRIADWNEVPWPAEVARAALADLEDTP